MSDLTVTYNSQEIIPVPLVSQDTQFLDYGQRYGVSHKINLRGYLTGLTSVNDTQNITKIFSDQFKTLEVSETGYPIYTWDNIVVESIDFDKSNYLIGGMVPWSANLISYSIPSGVIEPVNEYSFDQSVDGIVSVSHKVSAKGIKNNEGALQNAIDFVSNLVGKSNYQNCVSLLVPKGSGILTSVSEEINRINGSYSVTENFKYVTGEYLSYLLTTNLSITDSPDNDYTILDLSAIYQGSSLDDSISNLTTNITSHPISILESTYNIDTGFLQPVNFNINQDSNTNKIELKSSYISGKSNEISGYFDYTISFESNEVSTEKTWKINGEFICKGPLEYRQSRMDSFQNGIGADLPGYLYNLIINSPLYNNYATIDIAEIPENYSNTINSGDAKFSLSASFTDKFLIDNYRSINYTIESSPSKWLYELIPSANIEGHYVVQDLQAQSKSNITINLEGNTVNTLSTGDISGITGIMGTIIDTYIESGFKTSESYSSGIRGIRIETSYLGDDIIGSGIINRRVHGSLTSNSLRSPNYKFGY